MELYPSFAPETVANFLAYVNDGAYENTLIHRSAKYQDGTPFVIQTGGYTANSSLSPIAEFPSIPNEFSLRNIRGSVAMALVGSDSNSATSQWFINLSDNTLNLDDTNAAGNPPFTVFAHVLGNGMSNIVDRIASLPWYTDGTFTELPLQGVAPGQSNLLLSNLVAITRIATLPYFTVSADSSAYTSSISGTNLIITYTGGTNPPSVPVWITAVATDTNGLTTNSPFRVWHRTNQVRTIDYPVIPNQSYTTNPFYLPYWPELSDGTSFSGGISFSGPLAQAKNGSYYYTGTGTLTLTYVQPGNLFFRGVTNTSSFVISKALQTITFPILSNPVVFSTNPYTLTNLPFSSSTLPVALSIASNSPARWRVANSQLLFTGVGTVTLVASQSGNSNYLPASQITNILVVSKALQAITFPTLSNRILPLAPFPLSGTSSSGLQVTYTLISNSPASLTNGNTLRINGPGVITVVVNQAGTSVYLPATPLTNSFRAASNQTISPFGRIPNKTFTTNPPPFGISPLPATKSGLPVTITVKSGPATIGSNNLLAITGAGKVILAANQSGNSNYFPASEVTTSFDVSKASQTIRPFTGLPFKLTNGISPLAVTIPSASSGLPGTYLRVSGAGYLSSTNTITLTNAGTLTITATHAGNSNYLTSSLTTKITVAKGSQTIAFPGTDVVCEVGKTYSLNAISSANLPITYSLIPKNTVNASLSGGSLTIKSITTNTIGIVATQLGNSGYFPAKNKTNFFTIIANQGNGGSSGGSISIGGGGYIPYTPPLITNGSTFGK